jgi:hypothetical protein
LVRPVDAGGTVRRSLNPARTGRLIRGWVCGGRADGAESRDRVMPDGPAGAGRRRTSSGGLGHPIPLA